jgi:hypothetical protein
MKYILELVLSTIIIFFVWNSLKRIFFKKYYQFPPSDKQNSSQNKKNKKNEKDINWDAETVDYEEIKDKK